MGSLNPKVLGPYTPAAADADGYAESQTPSAGGEQSLTLDGNLVTSGVGEADLARRVLLTTVADETSRTFTVTGTDRYGNTISEDVDGVNNTTAFTDLDFLTVTSITVDDDTAGAVTFGTNGVLSTAWVPLNQWKTPFDVSIRGVITGTINWDLEYTQDDVFTSLGPFEVIDDANLAGETASGETSLESPVAAVRFTINSFTTDATLKGIIRQSGA